MDLYQEIERFPGALGVEAAHTPPATWYTADDFFRLDSLVLKDQWQYVGSIDFLSEPGSYFSGDFSGEPYLVVKAEDGNLQAFFNVCRHHATCLAQGSGVRKEFVCSYHGWTYGLDGALKRAPHLGAVKNFDKNQMGLVPIPLQLFGPLIFLNFSRKQTSLPKDWQQLQSSLAATHWQQLRFVKRKSYEIGCNWKVYVDNYLDGGYHVEHLHRGLAEQLDLEAYTIENFATHTVQSCSATSSRSSQEGDFRERIGDRALYAWLYPNFMINRYGNIMDTNWVIPLASDRCLTVFDYYFLEPESPATQKLIESSLQASDRVQQEDIGICESVQRGLGSLAYDVGRYSAKLETGAYLFHQLLQRDLRKLARPIS